MEVEYEVRTGDIAKAIVTFAEESKCDMIIMASRGRGGLGKFVLGSVAGTVLASCGKPVLVLSEATSGVAIDDAIRQQSAYLATVLWNKQAQGRMTGAEAKRKIELVAAEGLDMGVLMSTYDALEEQGGIPFGWLDINFQLDTLRMFLPGEIEGRVHEQLSVDTGERWAA